MALGHCGRFQNPVQAVDALPGAGIHFLAGPGGASPAVPGRTAAVRFEGRQPAGSGRSPCRGILRRIRPRSGRRPRAGRVPGGCNQQAGIHPLGRFRAGVVVARVRRCRRRANRCGTVSEVRLRRDEGRAAASWTVRGRWPRKIRAPLSASISRPATLRLRVRTLPSPNRMTRSSDSDVRTARPAPGHTRREAREALPVVSWLPLRAFLNAKCFKPNHTPSSRVIGRQRYNYSVW
jgi:hypothetical protein